MTRTKSLTDLREKVAAANAPKYSFIMEARVPSVWACLDAANRPNAYAAYNGSLDAAKALHEAVLGGDAEVHEMGHSQSGGWYVILSAKVSPHYFYAGTQTEENYQPSVAWLLCIIDVEIAALIAQEAAQSAEGVE